MPNWIWHTYVCTHSIHLHIHTMYSCRQKRSADPAKPIWHTQIILCFFLSTHPLYCTIYGLRVHGTVLSVSLVHCLFQGKNLCAAGEHELHTGWIMNKRTTCRRTGTLRIRHEVRGAANGNTWKGLTGRGLGCPPLQCHVEHCAQLLGKYCDFIWVRLTLSLRHAAYERCAILDKQQGRTAHVCMPVCVWVCMVRVSVFFNFT